MTTRNHLLYLARFRAGSTPKIANKNLQQKFLPGFITIPSTDYGLLFGIKTGMGAGDYDDDVVASTLTHVILAS